MRRRTQAAEPACDILRMAPPTQYVVPACRPARALALGQATIPRRPAPGAKLPPVFVPHPELCPTRPRGRPPRRDPGPDRGAPRDRGEDVRQDHGLRAGFRVLRPCALGRAHQGRSRAAACQIAVASTPLAQNSGTRLDGRIWMADGLPDVSVAAAACKEWQDVAAYAAPSSEHQRDDHQYGKRGPSYGEQNYTFCEAGCFFPQDILGVF